jgi:hypothetical protein
MNDYKLPTAKVVQNFLNEMGLQISHTSKGLTHHITVKTEKELDLPDQLLVSRPMVPKLYHSMIPFLKNQNT